MANHPRPYGIPCSVQRHNMNYLVAYRTVNGQSNDIPCRIPRHIMYGPTGCCVYSALWHAVTRVYGITARREANGPTAYRATLQHTFRWIGLSIKPRQWLGFHHSNTCRALTLHALTMFPWEFSCTTHQRPSVLVHFYHIAL